MHNGSAEIKFDPEGWWGFSIQGHVFFFCYWVKCKSIQWTFSSVSFRSLLFLTGEAG